MKPADDICYTLIDFEDGINLGWIPEEYALEFLVKLVAESIDKEKIQQDEFKSQRVSYLRLFSHQYTYQRSFVQIFVENEEEILNGNFESSLLSKSKFKSQMKSIIEVSVEKVYKSSEVIEKELTGYKVLNFLLKTFTNSVMN